MRRVFAHREAAIVIVGLGLAIRLLLLVLVGSTPLLGDPASYNEMAQSYLHGPLNPLWAPGLPLYLAFIHRLGGSTPLILRCAMLPFYLGVCLFAYRAALLLGRSRMAANLTLLVLAISPACVLASVEPMTELPAAMCLLLLACILLPLSARKHLPVAPALVAGVAIGYMALLRPSALVLLAAVPLYLLWRRTKLRAPVYLLLSGVLIVGGWVAYVHVQTGYYRINTGNSKNLFYGNNPRTPLYRTWWLASHKQLGQWDTPPESAAAQVAREAEFTGMAKTYIAQHPGLFLLRTLNRVCTFFSFNAFAGSWFLQNYAFPRAVVLLISALDAALYILIAAASILYVGTLRYPSLASRQTLVMVALILLYAVPYFVAFAHPRMHFPIEPLLAVMFSALAASRLRGTDADWSNRLHRRGWALAVLLAGFTCIQLEFFILAGLRGLRG